MHIKASACTDWRKPISASSSIVIRQDKPHYRASEATITNTPLLIFGESQKMEAVTYLTTEYSIPTTQNPNPKN